jgi:hypothetical protein
LGGFRRAGRSMRCLGRSPSLSAQESGNLGRRIQHTYRRQTHRLQRRIRIFVMSAAMAPAQSYLVTRDTAAAARCASADPTGSATAIAGGAVTSGLLDDGGGVAQRVNAGSGALLSLGAGRERKRPKHQHRCTQCQCKLFHAISSSPQENAPTQICWMVAWRRSKSPRDWFICINQR